MPIAAGVLYPAFGLLLNPMIASVAMSLSSVLVVGDALQLNTVGYERGFPWLTGARKAISVSAMQPRWRRLVVLLVALAFLVGGVVGVATPGAAAAEPCTEGHGHGHGEHHAGGHQHGKKSPQQNSDQRACLQYCCVGICASVPHLPTALTSEPLKIMLVSYWDTARLGAGRSVKPEHGPPKPLA